MSFQLLSNPIIADTWKTLSPVLLIPHYKIINCRIPETQNLAFSRECDVTINQDNLSTSIYRRKKHLLALALTATAL